MTGELDFSILDKLSEAHPDDGAERGDTLAQGALNEGRVCREIPGTTNALKSHSGVSQGVSNKIAAQEREKEAVREVYRAHQEAIRRGGALMSEVTKGIASGVAPERILLTACEVIGAMTGDTLFYEQNRENLKAIYGVGLLEPVPLQIELEDVRRRLAMLTRPELQDEPPESRARIGRAVKAHEERAAALEARIGTTDKAVAVSAMDTKQTAKPA